MMKQSLKEVLLGLVLVLILFPHIASAATYYVATNGNDGNPGTDASPWRTIQKAANMAVAGDTVYVKAGTYNERVVFNTNSGTANNWITFKNYGTDIATIDGMGITVQGHPAGEMWQGLVDFRDRNYIKFIGLSVKNSDFFGIYVNGGTNILIEKNYIYHTWASGIMVERTHDFTINANELELTNDAGDTNRQGAQEMISVSTGVDNFIISNNYNHDVGYAYNPAGGEGIDAKNGASNGWIYGNTIENGYSVGIYVDAYGSYANNIYVYNNTVINTTQCYAVSAEANGGHAYDISIYNNLGYNCRSWGLTIPAYQEGTATIERVSVFNNVFYNDNGGLWLNTYWPGTTLRDINIYNNIVDSNTGFSIKNEIGAAVNLHHNLVHDFKGTASETVGSNAITGDPLFTNAGMYDFTLQSNSPAIDAGTATGAPAVDKLGVTRPQGSGYDIGAYEYSSTTTPPPVCTPNWKCESPLNGYEYDGCGKRRTNAACNPITPQPVCTPNWQCRQPLDGYEHDANNCGSADRLNSACNAPAPQTQSPYEGTARSIPGTIQVEDFDNGGEGVAYHDTDSANQGTWNSINNYRSSEGVDIEATSGGGYNIGWTFAGEWLEYSVNVASAGTYSIEIPVASYGSGGTFHIEFNGVDKTGSITVPDTGGWQAWTTLTKSVSLSAGTQVMKIVMDTVGATGNMGNIDYVKISQGTTPPPTCTPSWRCESPLNGYEADGCNNRRLNSACNAPAPSNPSLAAATDNSLAWTTGGNANWFGETSTYYYGNDAAQSGKMGDSQTTWMQTTVTGPGTISFYWKVSSEPYYDYLKFYIDGILKAKISGTVNWNIKSYTITSGTHTLRWSYVKDRNIVKGSDAGWVDKVVYTPSSPTGAFFWFH